MIVLTIEDSKFKSNVDNLAKAFKQGIPKTILDVAHEIMRLSQIEVPHDKGTLQNSGVVQTEGDNVIVGYHQPYAARLHEHPEYRFGKGRKGKYLEDPIKRNESVLGVRFNAKLTGEVKNG